MDQKEFEKRLSQVAEWKLPDTPRETSLNAKKTRGRKSEELKYMEIREEIFHEEFGGINTTFPPMLTSVKRSAIDCQDCGEHCPNGRETEAKLHQKKDKSCWRRKCVTCGYFQNPFTGKFDLKGVAASSRWNDYLLGNQRQYYKKTFRPTEQANGVIVEENDSVCITSYPSTVDEK
jgi:hypothetical protein